MEDELIQDDYLSIEEKSLLPSAGFFIPESLREVEREAVLEEMAASRDIIMLSDSDADGLASIILGIEAFGEIGYITTNPNNLFNSLEDIEKFIEDGADLYISDLCPDSRDETVEVMRGVVEKAGDVYWLDHHEWSEDIMDALVEMGVDVEVGESDEVCAADVVKAKLEELGYTFNQQIAEVVDVTRDHDLWLKEDPRSDDLADLSVYLGSDEYIEVLREHGPDLDEEHRDYLEERREEKEALIEMAVERAEFHELAGYSIAQTYGRCSQNEVAEELREKGADAVTVVKPEGGTSLRGSEFFEKCHLVARELGGGGHPRAAGCKPDVFGSMLDYAEHWISCGERARMEVLRGYKEVLTGDE